MQDCTCLLSLTAVCNLDSAGSAAQRELEPEHVLVNVDAQFWHSESVTGP